MGLLVTLVSGFHPITNVKKNSLLDAVGVLDTPLINELLRIMSVKQQLQRWSMLLLISFVSTGMAILPCYWIFTF